MSDRLIKLPEVCAMIGRKRSKVYELTKSADFPRPFKDGEHRQSPVYYSEQEIQEWIEKQKGSLRKAG